MRVAEVSAAAGLLGLELLGAAVSAKLVLVMARAELLRV